MFECNKIPSHLQHRLYFTSFGMKQNRNQLFGIRCGGSCDRSASLPLLVKANVVRSFTFMTFCRGQHSLVTKIRCSSLNPIRNRYKLIQQHILTNTTLFL
uniref:Uncharacterized protein n=1 Tax=Setaria italica TaxID=4555 RepID=K3ZMN4_SETIT